MTQAQSFLHAKGNEYFLSGLKYWSVITAYGLAAAEGIKLTPLHLNVLEWLRQDYERHGSSTIARLVLRIENALADQGGNLLLLSLFPKGHLQALKIAGLPVQPGMPQRTVSMH